MALHRVAPLALLLALLAAGPAWAQQGIDCTKPRGTVVRAICGSPQLLASDAAMARAYAQAMADPAQAEATRAAQLAWIREREAICGKLTDTRALEACLARSAAQRLAQLTPLPAAPPVIAQLPPRTPVVSAAAATPPEPLAKPLADPLAETLVSPAPPAVVVPPAAANLDRTSLPAAEQMETMLHVTQPGRFAIAAKSATGVALQLVDMLTGPSDTMGLAGQSDGRIDTLLDVGTYKLRAFAAPQASGDVQLSVLPFTDAAEAGGLPLHGRLDAELSDFRQRRFWLSVPDGNLPQIEASGRALADLRLFRNGTDLVDLAPGSRVLEPTPGHPLTQITLSGSVEPGIYEAVAYGGPPLSWPDGTKGEPFHLRASALVLADGYVSARIGPMGSEVFRTGAQTGALRLDLPQVAAVTMHVQEGQSAFIAKNSRSPTTWLYLPPGEQVVTVRGVEGQIFRLQALGRMAGGLAAGPGSFWTALSAPGLGGDEPPPSGLLLRMHTGELPKIEGSVGVRVGPGLGWRQRFNLRGRFTMLLEVTGAGKIATRIDGVSARADIVPFGLEPETRADGVAQTVWDLAAGWYVLGVTPQAGASGIVDLSVGAPDALPAAPGQAGPVDPSQFFGLVTPPPGDTYATYTGSAVGAAIGLVARPVPIDLTAGPLAVTLAPGAALEVPVRMPGDGDAVASEFGSGPLQPTFDPVAGPTAGRIGTLRLAASDHARTVAIGWRAPSLPPMPIPPPPQTPPGTPLAAGRPQGLDLERDSARSFALDVPEGGLFRVETLGRLRTAGTIGTAFIPALDKAEANGSGQNMLIQRFLRAGRYRVTVAAHDSDGHLGVAARPAAVAAGATLVPGGRVRAAIQADSGVVFPVEIPAHGTYHLDLLSLGAGLTARLEDAQGWPILPAGDLSSLDQDLLAGHYRLLVQPTGVAARVVARLEPVTKPAARDGHGPFPLAFGTPQNATWREPAGRGDARAPDIWVFSLAGPADVRLEIGDGMAADLRGPDGASVGRLTNAAPFAATLAAGDYRVEAMSLGRNDRLDYTLALTSTSLQPGVARDVKLPATVAFAVAEERVVSLTSFGSVPVRAVLRRADGGVIGRFGERSDDWNIAIARRLPAGAYLLDVATAAPPRAVKVAASDPVNAAAASSDQPDAAADDDADGAADQSSTAQDNAASNSGDGTASNDTASNDTGSDAAATTVELRLALPPQRQSEMLDANGGAVLGGGGVHVLALPQAAPGHLLLASASSSAELSLALERQGGDGAWRTVEVRQGTAPIVGTVSDGAAWRVSVWTIDGGLEPVHVAARAVDGVAQAAGRLTVADTGLPGVPVSGFARIKLPDLGPVMLAASDASAGIETVSGPGRPLQTPDGGMIAPQTQDVWLVSRSGAANVDITPVSLKAGAALALSLPASGDAVLPSEGPPSGRLRVWVARSGLGQPGIDAGHGMGVASATALALGGEGSARIFNAAGENALRLSVTPLDLALQTSRALDAPFAGPLPPRSATPMRIPDGRHDLRLDLAPGTAAIAGWRARDAITAWAGDAAVSRTVEGGDSDLLVLNTGTQPAPVAIGWTPAASVDARLAAGAVFKRFFGAAGSLDMATGASGRLVVAGGEATLVGASGRVAQGTALDLAGAGRVMIDHGPGLLAAWVERPGGALPWPAPKPQAVALPARMPMQDAAMTLTFDAPTPMLLHARTTAPVILSLGDGAPVMFAAGAEFNRAIAAGPAVLRLISPHDGPLAGTLVLDGEAIAPAAEGVGAETAVAPGGSAAFGFEVVRAGPVGVGVRAEPDRLSVRLLAADGRELGAGVAQLLTLAPGRYVLEASVPPDGATTLLRPAIVGIARRPDGPPPDVVNTYLALAGRAPVAPVPVSAR